VAKADPAHTVAVVGATLIDGRGGAPVRDSVVVVRGDRIVAAGPRSAVRVPDGADVVDAAGLTLLPGLVDAHFHLDGRDDRPGVFLRHGVTAVRDPGAWIKDYDRARQAAKDPGGRPIPRLFLAGPHLDCAPAAHPKDAVIVTTPDEVRAAVNRNIDDGAVVIPAELTEETIRRALAKASKEHRLSDALEAGSSEELTVAIDSHDPGDTVTVEVVRGGSSTELTATLDKA